MRWTKTWEVLGRIERLALPTKVSSLLVALSLGALLGGGLQTLLQTSTPSVRELPSWRSETPRLNGHSESIQKSSVYMRTDFGRLNGSTTTSTASETGRSN